MLVLTAERILKEPRSNYDKWDGKKIQTFDAETSLGIGGGDVSILVHLFGPKKRPFKLP